MALAPMKRTAWPFLDRTGTGENRRSVSGKRGRTTPASTVRCSSPAVAPAATLTRWLLGRSRATALPASPLAGARGILEILLGADRLSVELSDSPSGELIREYLLARRRGVRSHLYARTVLNIPPASAPILTGRRFHAARTNTNRARREGIACRDLAEWERPRVLRALDESKLKLERTLDRWWVAEAADHTAVGVALATVDQEWAMLNLLVAPEYPARYLLHAHVVSSLQAAGVKYLTTRGPSALVQPPGLLYLQARLGYEIANLRVAPQRLAQPAE